MGRYCSVDQVAARFRKVSDVLSYPDAVDSEFIVYAENYLDGRLAPYFTTPFSTNNATARDLSIDLTYAKVVQWNDPKVAKSIMDSVDKRIGDLIDGAAVMLTDNGDGVTPIDGGSRAAWSNTASYHSAFGMDDAEFQHVSSLQLSDEEATRW